METESNKTTSAFGCFVIFCCSCIIIFFFLLFMSNQALTELLCALVAGWWIFLFKNLGQLHFNWEMIACGVVALGIGCYGFHRLALWLRKEKPWQWRWTLSIVSLMLFLFAASIAMTGIIHQSAWLVKSPVFENRRDGARTKSVGHLTQLKLAFVEYQDEKGKLPENLGQLRETTESLPDTLLYQQTEAGWEPWIYFGNLHNLSRDKEQILKLPLVMTPSPHGDKFVCIDTDGAINSMTLEQLFKNYPQLLNYLPHLAEQP